MKRITLKFVVLIITLDVLLVYSHPSHAAFSVPYTTTFNCPEQTQDSAGWPNCDGLQLAGAQHTSAGSGDQITIAANFPGGGGGRGHRFWVGPGHNNISGGLAYSWSVDATEMYVRWYQRYQVGLYGSGWKMQYYQSNFYFNPLNNAIRIVAAAPIIEVNGWGTDDLFDGSNPTNTSDGQWHCIETHYKIVPGSDNDIVEWWFDGVLRMSTTIANLGQQYGYHLFGQPSNGDWPTGLSNDFYIDTDDVAIQSTGPIGCTYGIPISNVPVAPTSLRVN